MDAEGLVPEDLLNRFNLGVAMTSAEGVWARQPNLQSPFANTITAPTLEYLSHFAYLPQNLYENTNLSKRAPFGAFIYRTTHGKLQIVPIGGDFEPAAAPEAVIDEEDLSETEQKNREKLRTLRPLFLPDRRVRHETNTLNGVLRQGGPVRASGSDSFRITHEGGTYNITVSNFEQGALQIQSDQGTATGNLSPSGAVTNASNNFQETLITLFPTILSAFVQVSQNRVRTIRESVSEAPEAHLHVFSSVIVGLGDRSHPFIQYLNLSQRSFIAIDAGGVCREHVSRMFQALVQTSKIFELDDHNLGQLKQNLNDQDHRTLLENLGTFLKWCHIKGGEFPTGIQLNQRFFDLLFNTVNLHPGASFSDEAIRTFYEDLDPNYIRALGVLDAPNRPNTDSGEEAFLDALLSAIDEHHGNAELATAFEDDSLSWETLQRRARELFIPYAKKKLSLESYELIARGIRDFNIGNQNYYRPTPTNSNSAVELNRSIQGFTNREKVADAFSYQGQEPAIRQKIRWLQEWILDKKTDIRKVEQFIQVITGSPALGEGTRFQITALPAPTNVSYPVYHTCMCQMDMPYGHAIDGNDGPQGTKKGFLGVFLFGLDLASAGFDMS